jgi:hypothetical protein
VQTSCAFSRRPAGPRAPSTRRPRPSSRWRSRSGGPDSRSAGAKTKPSRAARAGNVHRSSVRPSRPGRRTAPAPSLSGAARTRQGRLRRRLRRRPLTEPARSPGFAAIGSLRGCGPSSISQRGSWLEVFQPRHERMPQRNGEISDQHSIIGSGHSHLCGLRDPRDIPSVSVYPVRVMNSSCPKLSTT